MTAKTDSHIAAPQQALPHLAQPRFGLVHNEPGEAVRDQYRKGEDEKEESQAHNDRVEKGEAKAVRFIHQG